MARRRRAFRRNRGWVTMSGYGGTHVEKETVDNRLITLFTPSPFDGDQFLENSAIVGQVPTYYMQRLIMWWDIFPFPTALNQTGRLKYEFLIAVMDEERADEFRQTTNALTIMEQMHNFHAAAARILHHDARWAYAPSAQGEPATFLPDVAAMNSFQLDLSWKGVNIREDQTICFFVSQPSDTGIQPWLDGDALDVYMHAEALFTERRGM